MFEDVDLRIADPVQPQYVWYPDKPDQANTPLCTHGIGCLTHIVCHTHACTHACTHTCLCTVLCTAVSC
jgi:hypothetical protein